MESSIRNDPDDEPSPFDRGLSHALGMLAGYYLLAVFICIVCLLCALNRYLVAKVMDFRAIWSGDVKVADDSPVSLLEVKVALPSKLIFGDEEFVAGGYEPSELVQTAKLRLGEGTLGTLFKVVLMSGSTITIRRLRRGLLEPDHLEPWIRFFGGVRDLWLLPVLCSFWYGGEAFVVYPYLCLGSLEELLHGSEGIQFTQLSWPIRKQIALCAAMAVASIHTRVTPKGTALVCGVIKSSNILVRVDFSACLSGYEAPYLVPAQTIIRRNPGRLAPELLAAAPATSNTHAQASTTTPPSKAFTPESDVYSFGILLLELVTGKRPTVTNLVEYVKERSGDGDGIRGVCDGRIGEVKDGIFGMIGVAYQCLEVDPKDRPSMDRVVHLLHQLKN